MDLHPAFPGAAGLSLGMLGRARVMAKVLAAALVLTVLAGLSALAGFERHETLENALDRSQLMARSLEDHVTRTVDSTALILQTLGDGIARQATLEPARLQPLLAQGLLTSLPFLRSAAVLDEQGQVLASSIATEQGLHIDLARLGATPRVGRDLLLPWRPGRGLGDLVATETGPRAAGVGMLPLVRAVQAPGGQRLLLLALINPGALANFQQVALSSDGAVAMLAGLDGQLIAANDRTTLEPGASLRAHPVFSAWLPAREHGEYLGAGAQPEEQVVAFRASRTRPLVVMVELAKSSVLQAWWVQLRWLAALGALALAAIAGGLATLLREMNAREQARAALDVAHDQVALRERELSVLLKSVQELIFRTDAKGAITFVNARWAAISDDGVESARGRQFASLARPEDRARTAALFRLDDRAGVRQAQVCIAGADGQPRHFQLAVVPLHGDGRIVGFAGSAVDVSERVTAEVQLQHQLAFCGLLLEISPQPVSMFDAEGRYMLVNQAWEELVGRPRAEVIGTRVGHALPPADMELHSQQDARLLANGGRVRYEAQVPHRDGSRRDMVITKVLVPSPQGGAAGILCTLVDVSEFRNAERATRDARDAAEEASRAKSEFIANISHELRTPLQAIIGFSELGFARGSERPKLAAMFSDIHSSGQRMLALVNDLLDVSKVETSVGTFQMERCELRALVRAVLQELNPLLSQRRLRLLLTLGDEPLIAKVDPLRMHQALRNVIANAIKFSPDGGVLQIDGSAVTPDEFLLSVADRGPGIPTGELESIFEAFVQSSRTKDGSGGTGLGLAICRKIIEIQGGQITADNRPDGGAVFRIRLPLRVAGDSQTQSDYQALAA